MGSAVAAQRPVGRFERLAIERQNRDAALAKLPGGHPRGLTWDPAAGDRVIEFIETFCKHHKGEWAGSPLRLEEWQKRDVIRPIFGWKRADGTRRYRTAYVEIPRKNGKTELAGGIGLYLLVADGEAGAEVYVTATKRDQAKLAWDAAAAMVKQSADLGRFVKAARSNGGTLSCARLGSKMCPLGADSNTLDGLNPHGNLVDELHAHTDPRVWSVMRTALGARRQPVTLAITTAGVYDKESIGWQQHKYATELLEGSFEDDAYFAFIAAADEDDDPHDPVTWAKANPNLGISLKPDYIAEQSETAKRQPSFANDFLRLHLNRWTQQLTRWLPLDRWNECDATPVTVETHKGRECYAGLDLSTKLDLTALVLAFPSDGHVDLLARFWLPENTVSEAARKGDMRYSQWAADGWLCLTPGDVVDYEFIRSEIVKLGQVFSIREIAYDPWGATQIATQLGEADGFTVVETRQGYRSLSEPSKDFEARVVSRKVRHGGNPILKWCVGNAVVSTDAAGNIKPDKEKASERIDGVVAAIMALGRANLGGGDGVFSSGGLLSL